MHLSINTTVFLHWSAQSQNSLHVRTNVCVHTRACAQRTGPKNSHRFFTSCAKCWSDCATNGPLHHQLQIQQQQQFELKMKSWDQNHSQKKIFNWFSWKIKESQWLYFLFLLLLMCVQHFQEESFLTRKVSKCLGLLAVRTFGGQPGIWLKKLSLSFSNQECCLSTPSVSIALWRRSPLGGIRTAELLFNISQSSPCDKFFTQWADYSKN